MPTSDSNSPIRVLVTGAAGLLGTPLSRQLRADNGFTVTAVDKSELDITDAKRVGELVNKIAPDWIVNCAAFTRVDDCETHEPEATAVNGIGAGNLASAAASIGANIVHVSTDYVFDGDAKSPIPTDAPTGAPETLSAYGRSKLAGEQLVKEHHPRPTIVRTAWLYGEAGPCFPQAIVRLAREGKLKKVVNDQKGAPTFADDLADAIIRLIRANASGIFHVTNSGSCTWFEFANAILAESRIDCPIEPCTTAEFPRPAKRPAYSVLSLDAYENATGHKIRDWRSALKYFNSILA